MKVTEYLDQSKDTLFSFEIVPPVKGKSIEDFFENITPLMEFNPPFVDVTTSREQIVYQPLDQGNHKRITMRNRPGTVGICVALMHRFGVQAVPHVLCGGFTKEETEYMMIDLNYLGIKNILALRGDTRNDQSSFVPTEGGHRYATELLQQIRDMNRGQFLDSHVAEASSDFCVGVAGYPEKHFESPNMDYDLDILKQKVALGADYIVTQMFFDNQKYFRFVDLCRQEGITIPIIPGLKPISTFRQLQLLPQTFYLELPTELTKALLDNKDNPQTIRQIGIDWCIQQSKELKAAGVPIIHYYSMGKSTNVYEVASAIF